MSWWLLIFAGVLEIGWALGMKYTDSFTKPLPTLAVIVLAVFSIYLLNLTLKEIPVGTAYAVWTGIGAAGTAIAGIYLFGEEASIARFFCIALILAGIVGLHLVSEG